MEPSNRLIQHLSIGARSFVFLFLASWLLAAGISVYFAVMLLWLLVLLLLLTSLSLLHCYCVVVVVVVVVVDVVVVVAGFCPSYMNAFSDYIKFLAFSSRGFRPRHIRLVFISFPKIEFRYILASLQWCCLCGVISSFSYNRGCTPHSIEASCF